ncbi:MAG TPA: hypothetical protein VNR00_07250 [Opitutus sp.]|nr:hypothetical protein [Opitutus sp.]
MSFVAHSRLPRLAREFYQGRGIVLWTHTMEHRATGWLSPAFHHRFREILLHASHRYELAAPCYVLMPDHWHIMGMGLSDSADQWLATAFLRKHLRLALAPAHLQDRAHDHVLREHERARGAFAAACTYVLQNPERGGLCKDWREWSYLGGMVPGYPDLDPRSADFWDTFWKIRHRLADGPPSRGQRENVQSVPALTRRATAGHTPNVDPDCPEQSPVHP